MIFYLNFWWNIIIGGECSRIAFSTDLAAQKEAVVSIFLYHLFSDFPNTPNLNVVIIIFYRKMRTIKNLIRAKRLRKQKN